MLNEDVLGNRRPDAERGFVLHLIQLYPSIAVDINYRNTTELFFAFKPIFNFLAFTQVRQLRESVSEKLIDDFVPFCSQHLTKEGFTFVREKLTEYAVSADVAQPNRNKVYDVLHAMDAILDSNDFDYLEEGSKPRIGPKSKDSAHLKIQTKSLKKGAGLSLSASASETSIGSKDVSVALTKNQKVAHQGTSSEIINSQDPLNRKKEKTKANNSIKELKQAKAAQQDEEITVKKSKHQNGVSSSKENQEVPLKKKPSKELKFAKEEPELDIMDEEGQEEIDIYGMVQEDEEDIENDNRFNFIGRSNLKR